MLLHESYEARALPISVVVLLQVDNELRVLGESWVVTATTGCISAGKPATRLDDAVPVLDCGVGGGGGGVGGRLAHGREGGRGEEEEGGREGGRKRERES